MEVTSQNKDENNDNEEIESVVTLNDKLWEQRIKWVKRNKKGDAWAFFSHEEECDDDYDLSKLKEITLHCIICKELGKHKKGVICWKKENGSSSLTLHV